jgi:hypothetical protein
MRYLGLFVLVGLLMTIPPAVADHPPALSAAELDRIALDTLKDVHNRGAALYNTGDTLGCFRMYQGALLAIRPYLAHRPAIRTQIENGLADVEKGTVVKIQAFRLHEVIEQARSELKVELKRADASVRGPATEKLQSPASKLPISATPIVNPIPSPRVAPPEPVRSGPASMPTPVPPTLASPRPTSEPLAPPKADPGPPSVVELAPFPTLSTVPGPKPLAVPLPNDVEFVAKSGGTILLNDIPVEKGEVGLVCLDVKPARVVTGEIRAGRFTLDEEPLPGEYRVFVIGRGVPTKYSDPTSSGLSVRVVAGQKVQLKLELSK